MVVECSQCNKKYRIDESKIPPTGAKIKCKNCGTAIIVSPPAKEELSPPPQEVKLPPEPEAPPPPKAEVPPGLKVLLAEDEDQLAMEIGRQLKSVQAQAGRVKSSSGSIPRGWSTRQSWRGTTSTLLPGTARYWCQLKAISQASPSTWFCKRGFGHG